MNKKLLAELLIPAGIWLAGTGIGAVLAPAYPVGSGIAIIVFSAAAGLWFLVYDRSIVSFRFLLTLSWGVGEGMAAMRLSRLMKPWTWMSWASFLLFYLAWLSGFFAAETVLERKNTVRVRKSSRSFSEEAESRVKPDHPESRTEKDKADIRADAISPRASHRLFAAILLITAVSAACFAAEALILGYVPAFSEETHAYNYFHITGVHYFTVSGCLVPGLAAAWFLSGGGTVRRQRAAVLVCCLAALAVPVLSLSKFDLAVGVILPITVWLVMRPSLPVKKIAAVLAAAAVLLAAAAVYTTVSRHYEPGYIDSIFEMRDSGTPVSLQYLYMYVSNNYANFNELTMQIRDGQLTWTHGLRQLFPLFAFTGLKFTMPELVSFPIAVTKTELNTLTIIYDAYYDFGLAGVAGFGLIFGAACAAIRRAGKSGSPVAAFLYAETALYASLSFFSAWFSVPTTWFWYGITFLVWLAVRGADRKRKRGKSGKDSAAYPSGQPAGRAPGLH